ncbi:MAG: 30S ribosomal protein S12 methylthiotransferase RimO [Nitrospinae bacterium]|nr:30S ribosomal protein S12 methylthiotransferase RimO [Nitrospinota bacterium]
MKKIGMVSLGCPKNTVDSELVLGDLSKNGYRITADRQEADIIIVNTCGFIEASKRESIDAILDMAQWKTQGKCKRLVVTGCLAERHAEELLKEIPEIDLMLGVNQYPNLKNILGESLRDEPDGNGSRPGSAKTGRVQRRNHVHDPARYFESYAGRVLTTPGYTAYVKIAEGCSNKCAFCIIPKMRGPFRSRPLESVLEEARGLAARGTRELNLISQDTTMYGFDLRMKDGLVRLLKALGGVDGVEWLRLLYCYPTFVTGEVIDAIASGEKVCKYVDVPLQHTHDAMLKSMKRQETEKQVRGMLDELRRKVPGIALRTTFIVGFPGEKAEHFRHMVRFVEEMEFDHVGVFVYSNEEGTAAYGYTGKVPRKTAEARRDELMGIQREISRRKNAGRVGQTFPVLVEGSDAEEGYLTTGRLATQAPEIDGQVILEECDAQPGDIIPARIAGATDYDLVGRPV